MPLTATSPFTPSTSPFISARSPPRRRVTASVLTTSDAELQSLNLKVRRSAADLNLNALNDVFARVGFPRRDPERLRRALTSPAASLVWLQDIPSENPVAFARAVGDGVFNAVVWDVVVDPSLQGLGLGRAVMERLVDELRKKGVSNIALYAEPPVVGFYRPLGFAADPGGIKGMVYARRNRKGR